MALRTNPGALLRLLEAAEGSLYNRFGMQRCVWLTILLVTAAGVLGFGGQLLVAVDGSASFRTIQGAINAAGYGDTIVVRPGVYEERLELKAGTTVRGSGIGATVVRFAYGYEPLVSARNVSQCVVEDITLERAPSLLSAETVSIANASLTFNRCRVEGGSVGIDIRGTAGRVVFSQGIITGNASHGVMAGDGTRVELLNTEVSGNVGGGVAAWNAEQLRLTGAVISANGAYGVSIAGTIDAEASGCTLSMNNGAGWELAGDATVQVSNTMVTDNSGYAVQLRDDTEASFEECNFSGGEGLIASDCACLDLRGTSIEGMGDPAIRWTDFSTGSLSRVSVIGGTGTAVSVEGEARVTIERVTLADNDGTGVSVTGGTLELAQSIVVLNGAYGICVVAPGILRSRTNNIWGNVPEEVCGGPVLVGDVSVPPSFVDLESGNISLRPDSACLLPGVPGGALGAVIDPRIAPGMYARTAISWSGSVDGGGGLSATVRLAMNGGWNGGTLGHAEVTGLLTWPHGEVSLSADRGWVGTTAWSSRFRWGSLMQIGTIDADEAGDATLELSADVRGRLTGAETWLLADIGGSLVLEPVALDVRMTQSLPSGATVQELSVALIGSPWTWRASMALRDFGPMQGDLAFDRELSFRSADASISGLLCLFPTICGHVHLAAASVRGSVGLGATWGVIEPLQLSFSATDDDLGANVGAEWIASRGPSESMQLAIEAGKDLHWGTLGGRVVLGGGVRLELDVALELDALRTNRPPVAAFSVLGIQSDDPLTVWLDAAEAFDPDGSELSYEWIFEDGEVAFGAVVVHTFPEAGVYSVVLVVTDEEGAGSQAVRTIDVGEPSESDVAAQFLWSAEDRTGRPREGTARIGDILVVDAGHSSSRDEIVEFAWDVGGDGIVELRTDDPVAGLPLVNEGAIAVVLRVTDAAGRTGVLSQVIDVAARAAPTSGAVFSPESPLVGEAVKFTDLSTDDDGTVVAWTWSFGDGSQSDERHPTHTYADAGVHDVTLEVTDHEGMTGLTSLSIEVVASEDAVASTDVWALVIGISDYETVADLRYGREDAVAIARWALASGVPPDHLRILLDRQGTVDAVGGLSADTADLLQVREALGWLRREAGKDDLVIVSFSGHGARAEDDDGDESDGWDELFVLRDTIAGAEAETALRDDELASFVARIPSERVVLLLDTCFSGGAEEGGRTVSTTGQTEGALRESAEGERWSDLASSSTIILAAAGEGQVARESEVLQHGVFTHFFLEGVTGEADRDRDGRVTVREAAEYVRSEVDAFVFSWLGVHQQPVLTGRGDPSIVLARTP